ncbi:hypothetical protein [uncultured Robinsoniella sp.]|uniref:hypothetical protein n=1 Tax=uncultured Robinsoniella sp. TaxID=904190 RepID=UPI00374F3D2C
MHKKRFILIIIIAIIFLISSTLSYNTTYHLNKNEVKAIELWQGDLLIRITDKSDIAKLIDTLNNQIFITTIFPRQEKQGLLGLKFLNAEGQQIKWLTYDGDERRLYPLGGKISEKSKGVIDSILNKYNIP